MDVSVDGLGVVIPTYVGFNPTFDGYGVKSGLGYPWCVINDKDVATYRAAVSTVLRRLREQAGMTMTKLGEESGLTQTSVSYTEKGRRSPTVESLYRLSRTLGVSPAVILAMVDKEVASAPQGKARTKVRSSAKKEPRGSV